MKDDLRFLNELFRIVNGALRLDTGKVRNYTAFLADKLEKEGDLASANRLRKMLQESDHQLYPTDAKFTKTLPVDTESRFPLVEPASIRTLDEPPAFMPQDKWDMVNEFLSVAKSYAQLDTQDAAGSISLLMYGPPGTGKSRLARYIAKELGLELYIARLDGLISSFLGNTSKNIRALFDFAAKTPCVLFLDEFDAIAKLRGDNQELGELKRVVNSFIQNLDTLGSQSLILAATNHEDLLDSAIWRRFSYRLQLSLPNPVMRKKMWVAFSDRIQFKERDINLLVDLSDGFSGSDIRESCLRLRRKIITSNQPHSLKDIFQIIQNISIGDREQTKYISRLKDKDIQESVCALRDRDPKLYSLAALADLFGVSKTTIHRMLPEGVT